MGYGPKYKTPRIYGLRLNIVKPARIYTMVIPRVNGHMGIYVMEPWVI
jgi:hypothetical protein